MELKEIFDETTRKLIIMGSGLACSITVVAHLHIGMIHESNVALRWSEIITYSIFTILQVKMMYNTHKEG